MGKQEFAKGIVVNDYTEDGRIESRLYFNREKLTVKEVDIFIRYEYGTVLDKKGEPRRVKKNNETEIASREYIFEEITADQIKSYRKSNEPMMIYKDHDRYYKVAIDKKIGFVAENVHVCAITNKECGRLLATSDENGGCQKVRERATGIEIHDFVAVGYETINTEKDVYVVLECSHYIPCPPHKEYTREEKDKLRLSIAQYVWPDVENMREVYERKAKAKGIN